MPQCLAQFSYEDDTIVQFWYFGVIIDEKLSELIRKFFRRLEK